VRVEWSRGRRGCGWRSGDAASLPGHDYQTAASDTDAARKRVQLCCAGAPGSRSIPVLTSVDWKVKKDQYKS
jgi:hypothetical protein